MRQCKYSLAVVDTQWKSLSLKPQSFTKYSLQLTYEHQIIDLYEKMPFENVVEEFEYEYFRFVLGG